MDGISVQAALYQNSFTLSSSSILTGVNFGASGFENTTISTVDWAITTSPSTFPSSFNTAAVTTNSVVGTFGNGFGVTFQTMLDSFSLPNISLAGGTYYLVLQNATDGTAADDFFWDESSGGSSLASRIPPGGATPSDVSSESFQIMGTPAAATPLPAAFPLFATGLVVVGFLVRRRKRKAAALAA